jgi:hypothetical protein
MGRERDLEHERSRNLNEVYASWYERRCELHGREHKDRRQKK